MGYTRHNAIVVTAPGIVMRGEYGYTAPDVEAFRQSLPEDWRRLVVGPVASVVQDYQSYAFLPDGSKEKWSTSDEGDEYRQRFIDLFSPSRMGDMVLLDVRFGGDEPGAGYEPELIASVNPHATARGDA